MQSIQNQFRVFLAHKQDYSPLNNVKRLREGGPLLHLEEQYDRIYKYLYFRLHDRHAAEDMTQEAFLRFLRSRTYRDENRQLQYLYTIARNLCSQYYRDKVISYSLDEETERVLPIPAGTENDKPAPPGNEPWGIPDRPVAVYREMDMDIFRPSAVIHP